ncbi:M14 family zinc carboxypeptidase [Mesobacillus harenae]|uniref:M14 family zinc carboxypeptidase n=1 Tax=Mesobacillus harenae TaxID=2213203 RepID=UPI001F5513B9|nr:M14 family zinc carboxypeptidase [Mesobacillus harenae]
MQKAKLLFIAIIFSLSQFFFIGDVSAASSTIVNPNQVYSYHDMINDINKLKQKYPDLVHVKVVGKSEYGRNLYAVSLGKGPATVFINGSHHAREWMTTTLNMVMIEQYAAAYQKNTKIKGYDARKILNSTTIWFMPMINPDGVTLQQEGLKAFPKKDHKALIKMNAGSKNFKRWKANGKGVDLNRQYNAGWKAIKGPTAPSYKNFKGKTPESAVEVKAVLKLVAEIDPEMAVAYHSSGQILYWNYT